MARVFKFELNESDECHLHRLFLYYSEVLPLFVQSFSLPLWSLNSDWGLTCYCCSWSPSSCDQSCLNSGYMWQRKQNIPRNKLWKDTHTQLDWCRYCVTTAWNYHITQPWIKKFQVSGNVMKTHASHSAGFYPHLLLQVSVLLLQVQVFTQQTLVTTTFFTQVLLQLFCILHIDVNIWEKTVKAGLFKNLLFFLSCWCLRQTSRYLLVADPVQWSVYSALLFHCSVSCSSN